MGVHIVGGEFQSDKYPSCPAGKVPLSVKDKAAQPLLWRYAQTHRLIDAEFSDDLETALRAAGYSPPEAEQALVIRARLAVGCSWNDKDELEVRRILYDCAKRIEELAGIELPPEAHAVADCFAHEQEVVAAARKPWEPATDGKVNPAPQEDCIEGKEIPGAGLEPHHFTNDMQLKDWDCIAELRESLKECVGAGTEHYDDGEPPGLFQLGYQSESGAIEIDFEAQAICDRARAAISRSER